MLSQTFGKMGGSTSTECCCCHVLGLTNLSTIKCGVVWSLLVIMIWFSWFGLRWIGTHPKEDHASSSYKDGIVVLDIGGTVSGIGFWKYCRKLALLLKNLFMSILISLLWWWWSKACRIGDGMMGRNSWSKWWWELRIGLSVKGKKLSMELLGGPWISENVAKEGTTSWESSFFFMLEFQKFFTSLSVLPGRCLAIWAHLLLRKS